MAGFNSIEALKAEILKRMRNALSTAEDDIYGVYRQYNDEFYNEYTPFLYERTYQLRDNLDMSGIEPLANGYAANVYYHNDWNYKSQSGELTTGEIVNLIMHGEHDQHDVRAWDDATSELIGEGKGYQILKDALNSAGLPVS